MFGARMFARIVERFLGQAKKRGLQLGREARRFALQDQLGFDFVCRAEFLHEFLQSRQKTDRLNVERTQRKNDTAHVAQVAAQLIRDFAQFPFQFLVLALPQQFFRDADFHHQECQVLRDAVVNLARDARAFFGDGRFFRARVELRVAHDQRRRAREVRK